MLSGDARYDVHPGLTILVVAFTRNHNLIASGLQQAHPDWNDEKLYQEARKINIAVVQNIVYQGFLPALLGSGTSLSQPGAFNPSVDATISMPFSTAAFRLHTYVPTFFVTRDKTYAVSNQLQLRDIFHNLKITMNGNMYDDLIRGFASQPTQDFNGIYSAEMTEWLFPQIFSGGSLPAKIADFGADIVALNVQRGRDHKIQGYTFYL
jgi:peroxidase